MTEAKNQKANAIVERKSNLVNRLSATSQLAISCGFLTNALMTYQPNMSLGEAFFRYAVPSIGAAGAGALFEIGLRLNNKQIDCIKSFNDLVKVSTLKTAKYMGVSALGVASICGATYLAQNSIYNDNLERKAKAEATAKLTVLAPDTIVKETTIVVKTTAQQAACVWKKSGEVPFISPLDGKEYQVSCVGNDRAPK